MALVCVGLPEDAFSLRWVRVFSFEDALSSWSCFFRDSQKIESKYGQVVVDAFSGLAASYLRVGLGSLPRLCPSGGGPSKSDRKNDLPPRAAVPVGPTCQPRPPNETPPHSLPRFEKTLAHPRFPASLPGAASSRRRRRAQTQRREAEGAEPSPDSPDSIR